MSAVVVGVGGGIAAYKAAVLVRELMRRGHAVRVAMTAAAQRFVGPVTFTGLTGEPPVIDLWDSRYAGEVHVDLARWADAIVVAPATANSIARIANGITDDPVTATLLCFDGPVVLAPAMHERMWRNPATRRNVERLLADGAHFVGPAYGSLASGELGLGRMAEPEAIADAVERALAPRDLEGRTVLVSAGGTQEDLDPVRYLGNRSSGKMGFAIAERAARRGARTILVSGPSALPDPPGVEVVRVRSARDMEAAITARREEVDAIVMAAAVADYRPATRAEHKLKKTEGSLTIELVRNPDILAGLGAWRRGSRPMLVGFAVETRDLVASARDKLERKKVDLVVANDAAASFEKDTNRVVLVDAHGAVELPELPKHAVADRILDRIAAWQP
ncbi:MAG TPA: bifunctional phosphopantothenoylcysteine decarboxylase/phosphopantothenate--cysteine ligase CoaBC [Sandaracinaceae bacterium]